MKLKLTDEPIETPVESPADDTLGEQESTEPKRVKPTSIYAVVAAFVAAVAVVALFLWPKSETKPVEQTTVEQTTVAPVTTVETTTVMNETSTSAKAIEDARDTLERPTDVATEADTKTVSEAIESVLQFAKEGFKGDAYAHHSRYMDVTYVNMLKHVVQGKYTLNPSSIVVTNSEHSNVLQFAFDMTDEHGNTVAFAGNYRKFDTQIQLENIKGFNPTGSAVSDKQFDPDKAGFHE